MINDLILAELDGEQHSLVGTCRACRAVSNTGSPSIRKQGVPMKAFLSQNGAK